MFRFVLTCSPNTSSQISTNEPNDLAALPLMEGENMENRRRPTSFKITNVFLSSPSDNDGDQRPTSPTMEREEMPANPDGKAASFKILRVFPTASNDSDQRAATNKSSFKITNVFPTASNDGNKN